MKQLDKGITLGTPFSIDVKGWENVERERILPSMKKGEIVNLGFQWYQYGVD